jgi:hypothetical protein
MLVKLRRLSLAMSGLTFAVIAIAATFAPQLVARNYALSLNGVDGLNEFRAIFMGFWAALAYAMITAARKPERIMLGDVCGVMLLLQALGRAVSMVVDGVPSLNFVGAFLGELSMAVLVLLPRATRGRVDTPT